MGKFRRANPEGIVQEDLLGSIGYMIIPPDDMGNLHIDIIRDDGKVVCRAPVAADQYKILNCLILDRDRPVDHIGISDHPRRNTEPDRI